MNLKIFFLVIWEEGIVNCLNIIKRGHNSKNIIDSRKTLIQGLIFRRNFDTNNKKKFYRSFYLILRTFFYFPNIYFPISSR